MRHVLILALLFSAHLVMGQKYYSKAGKVSFYSEAPMEKIEAENSTASTVIDISSGAMEWAVLIQGFKFEKALMQEHFNENYMESSTYPKAKFKGLIENIKSINLNRDGEYEVKVSGQLEIHGVTRPVVADGKFLVKNGKVTATSKLTVQVADYNIKIPKLMADNIAKNVEITVHADYQLMGSTP